MVVRSVALGNCVVYPAEMRTGCQIAVIILEGAASDGSEWLCPKIHFCPKYRESAQNIEKYRLGVEVRCLALEAFSNVQIDDRCKLNF
jgi:hypothetical protein